MGKHKITTLHFRKEYLLSLVLLKKNKKNDPHNHLAKKLSIPKTSAKNLLVYFEIIL